MDGSLLFTYKSSIILSVLSKAAVVTRPFILISTGVVESLSHPMGVGLDVNRDDLVPPVVYLETT